MLKGSTKIILTDVETGEQQVFEDENMVTTAIDKIINMEVAMNNVPNDYLLPIATKLLGGIMMFDDDLTESVDNINFPTEAHLVGYANQSTNTSDKFRGSYNAVESGKTATGYVSVWDFGTAQGNGTIKSIARTHNHGGAAPLYNFLGPFYQDCNSGNPTTDTYWTPIRYDGDYLYMIKGNSSTHIMRLARVKIPMLQMGVADYSDVARSYEIIGSWDTEVFEYTYYTSNRRYQYDVVVYADDPLMYEDGQDGYIYCMCNGVYSGRDTDYAYDLCYFTVKYSDESFDKSNLTRFTTGISNYASNESEGRFPKRVYGHVNNGVYYMLGGNRKTIHIIPLSNPASYRTIRIIPDSSPDYISTLEYVSPVDGGVFFQVYHYTTSSYNYQNGILYPDGIYVLPEVSYGGTNDSHGSSQLYSYVRTMDKDLMNWGYYGNTYVRRSWTPNYLGTINNLPSEIVKTAAQTMKIVYTLTDVTDDD